MQCGGNARANVFFREHGILQNQDVNFRSIQSRAAELYRNKLARGCSTDRERDFSVQPEIAKPPLIVLTFLPVGNWKTDRKQTVSTELNSDERIARENNCNVEYSTDAHPDHKPYQQEHMLYESSHICVKSYWNVAGEVQRHFCNI